MRGVRVLRLFYHWLVRFLLLASVSVWSVNCAGREALRAADAAPRDVATGIMLGAEPVQIDRGRTRACLLLHGWISSPADFQHVVGSLDAAGWDVYAPLYPGHGTHPRDLEGITAAAILDATRARYAELRARYDRVALVGFSMGGSIATILAAEHNPDLLVLVAPFYQVTYRWYYVLPPRWWHHLLSSCIDYLPHRREHLRVNRREAVDEVVAYDAFPPDITRALFDLRSMAVDDVDASRLRMPLLVVYAPGDNVSSPRAVLRYLERIPAQDKRVLPCHRSDHYLLLDYDRLEAVAGILEFLSAP